MSWIICVIILILWLIGLAGLCRILGALNKDDTLPINLQEE